MAGQLIRDWRRVQMSAPHVVAAEPAGIVTFETDMRAKLRACRVGFLPKQAGTGDPSPTNPRAISGWTGVEVTRCGENLYDSSADLNGYINAYGVVSLDTTSGHTPLIPVKSGVKYTFSGRHVVSYSGNKRVHGYDADGNWVRQLGAYGVLNTGTDYSITVTVTSDIKYIALSFYKSDTSRMLVESSIVLDYEQYTGADYPISWQDDAGTVYGGYADPVNGEIVATHKVVVFDGTDKRFTGKSDAYGNRYYVNPMSAALMGLGAGEAATAQQAAAWGVMCNVAPVTDSAGTYPYLRYANIMAGTTINLQVVLDAADPIQTIEDFNAWLADLYANGTPMTVTVPLLESRWTRYALDQVKIKALKGVNYIWSDANGEITVKYWTH